MSVTEIKETIIKEPKKQKPKLGGGLATAARFKIF